MTKIEMQAMDAVIGIHREMKKANEPDWEQRRYEVARNLYVRTLMNTPLPSGVAPRETFKAAALIAKAAADVFIDVMKKEE